MKRNGEFELYFVSEEGMPPSHFLSIFSYNLSLEGESCAAMYTWVYLANKR